MFRVDNVEGLGFFYKGFGILCDKDPDCVFSSLLFSTTTQFVTIFYTTNEYYDLSLYMSKKIKKLYVMKLKIITF